MKVVVVVVLLLMVVMMMMMMIMVVVVVVMIMMILNYRHSIFCGFIQEINVDEQSQETKVIGQMSTF